MLRLVLMVCGFEVSDAAIDFRASGVAMISWQPLASNWKTRLRNKVILRNGRLRYVENLDRPRLKGESKNVRTRKIEGYPAKYLRFACRVGYEWVSLSTNIEKHRRLVAVAVARVLARRAL